MTTRLLLAAAGAGMAFAAPAVGTVSTLTTAPDGGWSHIADPRALYLAAVDKTVFGYVDGTSGDVEIRAYDNALGTVGSAVTLKAAVGGIEGNPDWHDNPAILRRASDGKLVAIYTPHSSAQCYRRISSNADDPSSFAAETNLDSQIGGTDYTYPYLTQLLDEASDPIYLFIRDGMTTGTTSLIYSTSTDGGSNWSAKTVLFSGLSSRDPYWKIASNGTDRIDIFTTDASMPNDPGTVKTYHFYMTGGAWFKSDGTSMGSPPFDSGDPTLVYDGSDGRGWPVDTTIDNDGDPRVLLQITDTGETFDIIRDYRLRFGAWVGYDVVPNIGEVLYANAAYDQSDPNTVYSGKKVGSWVHMHRYRTTDNGVSWVGTDLEPASVSNSGTPSPVFGRVASANDLAVIWFNGTWVDYLDYDVGVKGLVF